jgi:Flp pilus assembly pilin Flp
MRILSQLSRLLRDMRGISSVEYGLMLGLIVLVMLGALSGFATEIQSTWTNVATQAQSATGNAVAGA